MMKKSLLMFSMIAFTTTGIHTYTHSQQIKESEVSNQPKTIYQAKNFDYLLGKVDGMDDALLSMHFKLYQGYVKNANELLQKLEALNATKQNRTQEYAGLKRMLGWEIDGMILHEYYFENLKKSDFLKESDPLYQKIKQDFGSFDAWKADFIATGLIRGIGWVVTYQDAKSGRLVNEWINEHDLGHLVGAKPILIMDVFEHAYITQYGLDRNKYIEIFFNNVNWDLASQRYQNNSNSR